MQMLKMKKLKMWKKKCKKQVDFKDMTLKNREIETVRKRCRKWKLMKKKYADIGSYERRNRVLKV